MCAFYIQSQPPTIASSPRIRQEGFQIQSTPPSLNAPPSPTAQFDNQSPFFPGSHNVFPNAFKKFNDRNAIDFSDTLASILSSDPNDDPNRGLVGPSGTTNGMHHHQSGLDYPPASPPTHSSSHYFDMSYPSQFATATYNRGGPTDLGAPDVSASTTPGALHDSTSGLGNNQASSLNHGTFVHVDPSLGFHHQTNAPRHHQSSQHQHRTQQTASSFPNPPTGLRPVVPRLNSVRTSSPADAVGNASSTPSDTNVNSNNGMNVLPSSPYDSFPPSIAGVGVSIGPPPPPSSHLANSTSNVAAGNVQGVQPSSGALRRNSSRSRSRSRPATASTIPSAGPGMGMGMSVGGSIMVGTSATSSVRASSKGGMGKRRTQSISSPSPPAGTTASSLASNGVGSSSTGGPGGARPASMSIVIPDVRSPINQHTLNGGMVASPTTTGASASWGVFSPSSAQTAFSLPTGHGMGDVGPGGAGTSYGGSTAYNSQGGPPSGIIVDEDTMSSTKDDAQSKQQAVISEKRRKRRESHNAVERRRRDNINEKISELATLIPECLLLEGSSQINGSGHHIGGSASSSTGGAGPTGSPATGNGGPHSASGLSASGLPLLGDDGVMIKSEILQEHLSLSVDMGNPLPPGPGLSATAASLPFPGSGSTAADEETLNANQALKANKGVILRKSVDYIRYLQQLVRLQAEKNRDLESELSQYRPGGIASHSSLSMHNGLHSSTSSSSDPSHVMTNAVMYPPGSSSSVNPADFGPADFATFDLSRNFRDLSGRGGGGHLVSVKEEESNGLMDLNVLPGPEDFQTPPSDHSHQSLSHSQTRDFFSSPGTALNNNNNNKTMSMSGGSPNGVYGGNSVFDMNAFPPTTPTTYLPYYPSPLHHSQHPSSHVLHSHLQHQRSSSSHMDGSPSAVGSGSGHSDLENVEEEDEDGDNDDTAASSRGRKGMRENQGGARFSHASSANAASQQARSVSGSRSRARNQNSASQSHSQSGRSMLDDMMHVDERG